jgi:hypothetical protein
MLAAKKAMMRQTKEMGYLTFYYSSSGNSAHSAR